jgi:NAD(P)-dependent dehydrogenase (short-subunit alcohol dehydrogenase family)
LLRPVPPRSLCPPSKPARPFRPAGPLAADNIAITCVDPGFTRTELVDILGQRGLVDPGAAHPMEVPVAAVLDVITSDDPLTRSGHIIRA